MWKITKKYSHISCKTYRKLAQVNYPKQNYPATEHMCSKEEFENHLRRLFFFAKLMDLIILHSPIGNRKEPALSN